MFPKSVENDRGWLLEGVDARGCRACRPFWANGLTGRSRKDQTESQYLLAVMQFDGARKVMTFGPLSFLRLEKQHMLVWIQTIEPPEAALGFLDVLCAGSTAPSLIDASQRATSLASAYFPRRLGNANTGTGNCRRESACLKASTVT